MELAVLTHRSIIQYPVHKLSAAHNTFSCMLQRSGHLLTALRQRSSFDTDRTTINLDIECATTPFGAWLQAAANWRAHHERPAKSFQDAVPKCTPRGG
jgi:hypothetical protein